MDSSLRLKQFRAFNSSKLGIIGSRERCVQFDIFNDVIVSMQTQMIYENYENKKMIEYQVVDMCC